MKAKEITEEKLNEIKAALRSMKDISASKTLSASAAVRALHDEIADLSRKGYSRKEICEILAEQLGVSASLVSNAIPNDAIADTGLTASRRAVYLLDRERIQAAKQALGRYAFRSEIGISVIDIVRVFREEIAMLLGLGISKAKVARIVAKQIGLDEKGILIALYKSGIKAPPPDVIPPSYLDT